MARLGQRPSPSVGDSRQRLFIAHRGSPIPVGWRSERFLQDLFPCCARARFGEPRRAPEPSSTIHFSAHRGSSIHTRQAKGKRKEETRLKAKPRDEDLCGVFVSNHDKDPFRKDEIKHRRRAGESIAFMSLFALSERIFRTRLGSPHGDPKPLLGS